MWKKLFWRKSSNATPYALLFFLLVLVIHVVIVHVKFLSCAEIFNGLPILNFDYGLHYYDVLKGVEFLNENMSFTGYDPAFMNGYLKGYIDDTSSKAWIIFAWLFQSLGVMSAYKLFIWLTLVSMPILFFAALRLWGFNFVQALTGMAIAILYQNTFKMGNFLWVGMITFPLAVYFMFLVLSFLKKYFSSEKNVYLVLFTLFGAVAFYIHILSAVLIGVSSLILYLVHYKKLNKTQHDRVFWAPIGILIINLWWIFPFVQALNMKDPAITTTFFQSPDLMTSLRELFWPFIDTFHHFNIRGFFLIGGIWSLWRNWQNKDARFIALSVLAFSVITYSGFDFLSEIQPYRFLVVGDLFLVMLILMNVRKWWLGVVVSFFLILSFVLPGTLKMERVLDNNFESEYESLVAYFERKEIDGRVLFEVEHSADAVFFHLKTGHEMIGGPYRYMFVKNEGAQFSEDSIFGRNIEDLREEEWRENLDIYRIKHAVCYSEKSCIEIEKTRFLKKAAEFGKHKVFDRVQF